MMGSYNTVANFKWLDIGKTIYLFEQVIVFVDVTKMNE